MSLSKTTLVVSLWYLNLVKREKSKDYEHEHARVFKSAERGEGQGFVGAQYIRLIVRSLMWDQRVAAQILTPMTMAHFRGPIY